MLQPLFGGAGTENLTQKRNQGLLERVSIGRPVAADPSVTKVIVQDSSSKLIAATGNCIRLEATPRSTNIGETPVPPGLFMILRG